MLYGSNLRSLSLYGADLAGGQAIEELIELIHFLPKLRFLNVCGNQIFQLDMLAFAKKMKKDMPSLVIQMA